MSECLCISLGFVGLIVWSMVKSPRMFLMAYGGVGAVTFAIAAISLMLDLRGSYTLATEKAPTSVRENPASYRPVSSSHRGFVVVPIYTSSSSSSSSSSRSSSSGSRYSGGYSSGK
jgi:hypothetical protein